MEIKIIETIRISPENLGLFNITASSLGCTSGDIEQCVIDYEIKNKKAERIAQITPSLYQYFGKMLEQKAHEAVALLPNAIDVEVTIKQ